MKLVARFVTALALLAFATPALPCSAMGEKTTTASSEKEKSEKKATPSTVAAKSSAQKKGATPTKSVSEAKPASATN